MFCMYCGGKIEEHYNVCPNCRALLKTPGQPQPQPMGQMPTNNQMYPGQYPGQVPMNYQMNPPKKSGKDTASLIFAIIGLYFCLSVFLSYEEIIKDNMELMEQSAVGFAIGMCTWNLLFGGLALGFALSSRKLSKTGVNTASLIMSAIIFAISVIQIVMIATYL